MKYEVIIIGAGPAGLTASVYASRYRLANLVIGKVIGGMVANAHLVENYLGFFSISGTELCKKMGEHARALGAEILTDGVTKIEKGPAGFKITTEDGGNFEGRTLIVATGTERRKLNVAGEKEYLGRGVSYCVNCDVPLFKDKIVALVGGSDAAVSGAIHAADFAKKTYIIYRRSQLRAEPTWTKQALAHPKVEVIYNTNIIEISGDGNKVTGVKLDHPYQNSAVLSLDGVFIEIGGVPGTSLVKSIGVDLDKRGYVKVDAEMNTNIPGVFAAGDIANVNNEFQQIVIATAEGAKAAFSAFKYLKGF